jgi:hypothetical protein
MYKISEIYILLYLFFLLSYIFVRHWIIPSIFNFIPGLIPVLMINQLAVLDHQSPSDVFQIFLKSAIYSIGGGVLLRWGLEGDSKAALYGVAIVGAIIIVSVVILKGSTSSPNVWVATIYVTSPLYFTTSIVTQLKHSEYQSSRVP